MKPTRNVQNSSNRHRRIGRKALQADRIVTALQAGSSREKHWWTPTSSLSRKSVIAISVGVIGLGVLGIGGSQLYFAHADKAEQAAIVKKQEAQKQQSIAADACRRKKAEQKADQLGKVTYDELYDYGECDQ